VRSGHTEHLSARCGIANVESDAILIAKDAATMGLPKGRVSLPGLERVVKSGRSVLFLTTIPM
jgi:hypothetical protein